MIPHKLHIEISGAVGSGRSLLARDLLEYLTDAPFEKLIPILFTEELYHAANGETYTEEEILKAAGNDPILLITINHNNTNHTH